MVVVVHSLLCLLLDVCGMFRGGCFIAPCHVRIGIDDDIEIEEIGEDAVEKTYMRRMTHVYEQEHVHVHVHVHVHGASSSRINMSMSVACTA